MSRACVVEWPIAVRRFGADFEAALHGSSHVRLANGMSAKRAVFTCAKIESQVEKIQRRGRGVCAVAAEKGPRAVQN